MQSVKTDLVVFAFVKGGKLLSYGIAFDGVPPPGAYVVSSFGEIVGGPDEGTRTCAIGMTYDTLEALGLSQIEVERVKAAQKRCELHRPELTRPLNG